MSFGQYFSFNQGYYSPERRVEPRIPYRAAVSIELDGGALVHGRAVDLSRGGMAFHCHEHLTPGERVRLRFTLVTGSRRSRKVGSAAVLVSVVHSSAVGQFRASALFEEAPPDTLAAIGDYVRHQAGISWLA